MPYRAPLVRDKRQQTIPVPGLGCFAFGQSPTGSAVFSMQLNSFQETLDWPFPCYAVRAFGDYGRLKTTSTLREMHHSPHAGTGGLSQALPDTQWPLHLASQCRTKGFGPHLVLLDFR